MFVNMNQSLPGLPVYSLLIVFFALIATYYFLNQPVFGKNPTGERLERIKKSPNYHDGKFHNQSPTEVMRPDVSYWELTKAYFNKPTDIEPAAALPHIETNLNQLHDSLPTLVWFGHSSYLIKHQGKTILVDPVFSGYAAPFSFMVNAFKGSNTYGVDQMPAIDVCIITHNHYDHLDKNTIQKLKHKVHTFVTPLGVGADLESWGVNSASIIELDWWETTTLPFALSVTAAPARHFSGRGFVRAKTLWASYVLQWQGLTIYAGGDSGYDSHFKEIGKRFGQFDLAILECGQYGKDWPLIHMTPEQVYTAATDLNARVLLPVHWAKFALSMHSWKEPITRLMAVADPKTLSVTTPLIGEEVHINGNWPKQRWWEDAR
jgi:L-ascorbate metabolism protein UlaG (beta-lactamase superfamily)